MSEQNFEVREGVTHVDFSTVHAWLTETYWSPGISQESVERAALYSSLVVGAYVGTQQIGYLRVVSDRTRFAYLCDVYVEAAHRGKGVATAMLDYALAHPEHQGLRRWLLATRDAHPVYAGRGFVPLPMPERWMVRLQESDPGL